MNMNWSKSSCVACYKQFAEDVHQLLEPHL